MKRLTSTVNKKRYRESQKEGGGRKQSVVAVGLKMKPYFKGTERILKIGKIVVSTEVALCSFHHSRECIIKGSDKQDMVYYCGYHFKLPIDLKPMYVECFLRFAHENLNDLDKKENKKILHVVCGKQCRNNLQKQMNRVINFVARKEGSHTSKSRTKAASWYTDGDRTTVKRSSINALVTWLSEQRNVDRFHGRKSPFL